MLNLHIKSKSFHSYRLLQDIHLALKAGERIAILGPSGRGKSTLLRIIAKLDQDFDGEISVTADMSLMFQTPNLLLWRTAKENLQIFHQDYDVEPALRAIGLAEKAHHYPRELSLGQQRRLALARSLLRPRELVLLDEPYASLDEGLRDEMLALSHEFIQNSALILVTHSEYEAKTLGCTILHLENGLHYGDL